MLRALCATGRVVVLCVRLLVCFDFALLSIIAYKTRDRKFRPTFCYYLAIPYKKGAFISDIMSSCDNNTLRLLLIRYSYFIRLTRSLTMTIESGLEKERMNPMLELKPLNAPAMNEIQVRNQCYKKEAHYREKLRQKVLSNGVLKWSKSLNHHVLRLPYATCDIMCAVHPDIESVLRPFMHVKSGNKHSRIWPYDSYGRVI